MAYEVLVLDVDGTLVNSQKVISEATKQAILKIQEEGIKVVIASGRSTPGVWPLARQLKLDQYGGYILSYNGGKITHCSDGEIVYNVSLPRELLREIYDFSVEQKIGIMTYYKSEIITENPEDPYIIMDAEACHIPIRTVENFREEVIFPVNKCLLTGEPDHLAKVEPIGKAAFEGRLSVYRSEGFYLEMMPLGIDKAFGLSRLLKAMGLERKQMICCGDGFNDVTMIEYAGLGVAMGNADDKVKAYADYIAPSCDEDGLVTVIHKYLKS